MALILDNQTMIYLDRLSCMMQNVAADLNCLIFACQRLFVSKRYELGSNVDMFTEWRGAGVAERA